MARHKDVVWNLAEPLPGMDGAQLAVLMDIRDELKAINVSLLPLRCHNFQRIPHILDAIKANTTKRKYTRKKKPHA